MQACRRQRVEWRNLGALIVAIWLILLLQGCAEVPITHRKGLHLVPETELLSISLQQYDEVLKKSKLSSDPQKVEMVRREGNRIAKTAADSQLFMTVFGVGANVGFLMPYNRLHESEADRIGLTLMARAGYDPRVAISFWERMSKQEGQRPPQFLSTHPAPETRIADIKKYLPEALPYFEKTAK